MVRTPAVLNLSCFWISLFVIQSKRVLQNAVTSIGLNFAERRGNAGSSPAELCPISSRFLFLTAEVLKNGFFVLSVRVRLLFLRIAQFGRAEQAYYAYRFWISLPFIFIKEGFLMSKFNQTQSIKTVNNCGQPAYKMTDKEKLVSQVLTSFFNESKFYGDNSEDMQKTIVNVIKAEPEFVSKLAIFARRVFNMRSVSHVLTAYLAHENEGKPFVRETVKGVTVRACVEMMSRRLWLFT